MNYIIFEGRDSFGGHLTRLLHEAHPERAIYNMDLVPPEQPRDSTFVKVDVRQPITADIATSPDDVIFNFAAIHRTPGYPDKDYFETNMLVPRTSPLMPAATAARTTLPSPVPLRLTEPRKN